MSMTQRQLIERFIRGGTTGSASEMWIETGKDGARIICHTRYRFGHGKMPLMVRLNTKAKNKNKIEFIINGDGMINGEKQGACRWALRDECANRGIDHTADNEFWATIPFSALLKAIPEDRLQDIRIVDKKADTYRDVPIFDENGQPVMENRQVWEGNEMKWKEVQKTRREHLLGGCVFELDGTYFISTTDPSNKLWGGGFFIAKLPCRATTMEQAFEVMKPKQIRKWRLPEIEVDRHRTKVIADKHEAYSKGEYYMRQGEFFFVPSKLNLRQLKRKFGVLAVDRMPETLKEMRESGVPWASQMRGFQVRNQNGVYKGLLLNRAYVREGNPHRARDVLLTEKGRIFARGCVYHPEHTTINLGEQWHEVLRSPTLGSWSAEGGRVD